MHAREFDVTFCLDGHCAGDSPLLLDGMYAAFSSVLPLEWTSSNAEVYVVDAVPLMADSLIENASELEGNIAVVARGGGVSFVDKVKRASEAGAAGVIVTNTEDDLIVMGGDEDYTSNIPVLMIKSNDAARLRDNGSGHIRGKGTRRSREVVFFQTSDRGCLLSYIFIK